MAPSASSRWQRTGRQGPANPTAGIPTLPVVVCTILILLAAAVQRQRGGIFTSDATINKKKPAEAACRYRKLSDLSPAERHPAAGKRHTVNPPADALGTVSLVCCRSTSGPMSIVVHRSWAPLGAARFLDMVKDRYFSTGVPFFRCISGWLCQFGIAGTSSVDRRWKDANLKDDPQWLPQGPQHKVNKEGVKRFAKGYLAYAGSGPNTRSNQFFVALAADESLAGGGNPWEVPFGELVGAESFRSLGKVYSGYGDGKDAPSQDVLHERGGNSRYVRGKWPLLDYITQCEVLDEA